MHLKMIPNPVKILIVLGIAGVILNVTNYMFYSLMDVTYHPRNVFKGRLRTQEENANNVKDEYHWTHELFNVTSNKSTDPINKLYQDIYNLCPEIPENLGPVEKDEIIMSFNGLKNMFFEVHSGGLFVPECEPRHSVAILVIFRGHDPLQLPEGSKESRVGTFLYYMHPFMMKQRVEYQIFVLQQYEEPYNTGALFNIGFHEVQKLRPGGWNCIIFHDIDFFPCDTRNLYRCTENPKQMVATCEPKCSLKPHLTRVVGVTPEQFTRVKGFSVLAWGSMEPPYENLYYKLVDAGYKIERNSKPVGEYINYNLQKVLKYDANLLNNYVENQGEEIMTGPPDLRYLILGIEVHRLFTTISVHVEFPPVSDYTDPTEALLNTTIV